jgi:hypothetical protein
VLSFPIALTSAEAEAIAAVLARVVLSEHEDDATRAAAAKLLQEIEHAQTSARLLRKRRR